MKISRRISISMEEIVVQSETHTYPLQHEKWLPVVQSHTKVETCELTLCCFHRKMCVCCKSNQPCSISKLAIHSLISKTDGMTTVAEYSVYCILIHLLNQRTKGNSQNCMLSTTECHLPDSNCKQMYSCSILGLFMV